MTKRSTKVGTSRASRDFWSATVERILNSPKIGKLAPPESIKRNQDVLLDVFGTEVGGNVTLEFSVEQRDALGTSVLVSNLTHGER